MRGKAAPPRPSLPMSPAPSRPPTARPSTCTWPMERGPCRRCCVPWTSTASAPRRSRCGGPPSTTSSWTSPAGRCATSPWTRQEWNMRIARETWIVFTRAMRLSLRNPVWIFIGLTQPILYLGLFGPLLEPMTQVPGMPQGDSWQWFVPGILIQLGIFGAAFVGFGLVAEYRAGVVERMRVTPASRIALLGGRVLRDVVVLLVQSAILVIVAMLFFGLDTPLAGLLIGLGLVGLLGVSLAALSYAVALTLKSEDAL